MACGSVSFFLSFFLFSGCSSRSANQSAAWVSFAGGQARRILSPPDEVDGSASDKTPGAESRMNVFLTSCVLCSMID